ncbi:MAG: SUMF1/EgtB/PvdO family nonheme iron enzyme [Dysgonamonadaceae bacterium]|jgi:formylglycine-generating enzyme required for sulfatase activity|nr:SUMF1/EgtB/PvdO family nonheme iron enzyme [Dysgonamonadaceae bacterium]
MKTLIQSSFLILFLALTGTGTSVSAQDMYIQMHRNGNIINVFNVLQIDSLTFCELLPSPTNVTATLDNNTIQVSWNSVAEATNYEVQRSSDNDAYTLLAEGIAGTSFTDNSPLNGTNYYKVKACNATLAGILSEASQVISYNEEGNKGGKTFTETVNGVSFDMIGVEGGTFTMGATAEQSSEYDYDERPAHSVTLSNYSIGKYEVTQGLWKAVMGTYPGEAPTSSYGLGDNYPVYNVSWSDATTFIDKLSELTGKNYHLPTEAEWEYAARGGKYSQGYEYNGSNDVNSVAWYDGNSGSSHPVGTKSPNELGIYDMSGNVWEWCYDWYDSYSSSAQTNPQGSSGGSFRVIRGGSWDFGSINCRVSFRCLSTPGIRFIYLGFRLALSL